MKEIFFAPFVLPFWDQLTYRTPRGQSVTVSKSDAGTKGHFSVVGRVVGASCLTCCGVSCRASCCVVSCRTSCCGVSCRASYGYACCTCYYCTYMYCKWRVVATQLVLQLIQVQLAFSQLAIIIAIPQDEEVSLGNWCTVLQSRSIHICRCGPYERVPSGRSAATLVASVMLRPDYRERERLQESDWQIGV